MAWDRAVWTAYVVRTALAKTRLADIHPLVDSEKPVVDKDELLNPSVREREELTESEIEARYDAFLKRGGWERYG